MSKFDDAYMSEEDRKRISQLQEGYINSNGNLRQEDVFHKDADTIRRKYGYSGGISGDKYIPVDSFKPIPLPQTKPYSAPWDRDIEAYLHDMEVSGAYESPYSNQINALVDMIEKKAPYEPKYQMYIDKGIREMLDYHPYQYDPNSDVAFQRFLTNVKGASEEAYEDNLASFASMSGGNISSWAEEAAKQAKDAMNEQAQLAVEKFDDLAFNKHRFETGDTFKRLSVSIGAENQAVDEYSKSFNNRLALLDTILRQDEIGYNRVRDKINDDKEMGRFLLSLDRQTFEQYKYVSEQAFIKFKEEANQYRDELNFKKQQFDNALRRTELNGFVNNEDAITLGVDVGTPSKSAREHAEDIKFYYEKNEQAIKLENDKIERKFNMDKAFEEMYHKFNLEKMDLNNSIAIEKDAISRRIKEAQEYGEYKDSQWENLTGEKVDNSVNSLNSTDWGKVKKENEALKKYFKSSEFKNLSNDEKYKAIENKMATINNYALNNHWGKKNSLGIGACVVDLMKSMPEVVSVMGKSRAEGVNMQYNFDNSPILSGVMNAELSPYDRQVKGKMAFEKSLRDSKKSLGARLYENAKFMKDNEDFESDNFYNNNKRSYENLYSINGIKVDTYNPTNKQPNNNKKSYAEKFFGKDNNVKIKKRFTSR